MALDYTLIAYVFDILQNLYILQNFLTAKHIGIRKGGFTGQLSASTWREQLRPGSVSAPIISFYIALVSCRRCQTPAQWFLSETRRDEMTNLFNPHDIGLNAPMEVKCKDVVKTKLSPDDSGNKTMQ